MKIQYPYGAGSIKLVSTDWLSAHLADMDLTIWMYSANITTMSRNIFPVLFYLNEGPHACLPGGPPGPLGSAEVIAARPQSRRHRSDKAIVVYTGTGVSKALGRWF